MKKVALAVVFLLLAGSLLFAGGQTEKSEIKVVNRKVPKSPIKPMTLLISIIPVFHSQRA